MLEKFKQNEDLPQSVESPENGENELGMGKLSPEQFKKSIEEYFSLAKNHLNKVYGIDNLSIIEQKRLKEITENAFVQDEQDYREMYKALREGNDQLANEISRGRPKLDYAIAQKWLFEMYGIYWADIDDLPFDERFVRVDRARQDAQTPKPKEK